MIMRSRRNAFTLGELVVGVLLTSIVVGVCMYGIMQSLQNCIRSQRILSENNNFYIAGSHLRRRLRDAAFVKIIDNGSGLELYDSGELLLGNYALSEDGLYFDNKEIAKGVSLEFSGLEKIDGRDSTVFANFYEPLETIICITCRRGTSSWARTFAEAEHYISNLRRYLLKEGDGNR